MKIRATVWSLIATTTGLIACIPLTGATTGEPIMTLLEYVINDGYLLSPWATAAVTITNPVPMMIVSGVLCVMLVLLEVLTKRTDMRFLFQFLLLAVWVGVILAARSVVFSTLQDAEDWWVPNSSYTRYEETDSQQDSSSVRQEAAAQE